MRQRKRAAQLNALAGELQEQGEPDRAIELYLQADAADPTWSVPLYNLGLLFKNQRQWDESAKYNRRATTVDPKNEAAWWNLGIAATALGRWELARQAWRGFGIQVPDGEGPIDFPCGFGPFRLNPDGDGEVVWAYRLDPARAEIASIPLPESGFRWSDVVLNDGAPVGYRKYKGKNVPVFNVIHLLEASRFGTYVAHVAMPPEHEHLVRLAEVAERLEGAAEDWSTSVRILCKACSEGRAHKEHDTQAAPADGFHVLGVAARDREQAEAILSTWTEGVDGIRIESLEVVLEPEGDG
jgi:tetratricopeptide (TPR) repeat protein